MCQSARARKLWIWPNKRERSHQIQSSLFVEIEPIFRKPGQIRMGWIKGLPTLHYINVYKKSPGRIKTQSRYLQRKWPASPQVFKMVHNNCVSNQCLGPVLKAPSTKSVCSASFQTGLNQEANPQQERQNLPNILKIGNDMNKATEINCDQLRQILRKCQSKQSNLIQEGFGISFAAVKLRIQVWKMLHTVNKLSNEVALQKIQENNALFFNQNNAFCAFWRRMLHGSDHGTMVSSCVVMCRPCRFESLRGRVGEHLRGSAASSAGRRWAKSGG